MKMNGAEDDEDREVVMIAGISERVAAYAQAVEKSRVVEKKQAPVFKVEDGMLDGSFSNNEEEEAGSHNADSISHLQEEGPVDDPNNSAVDHHLSMNDLRPGGFFGTSCFFGATYEELGLDPEKPKEVLEKEENETRSRVAHLLARFELPLGLGDDDGSLAGRSVETVPKFDIVQKRYLKAVDQLRPEELKPEKYTGPAEEAFSTLKEDYEMEQTKAAQFGDLQDRWYDYDGAANDNRWYEWCATAKDLPDIPSRNLTESETEHQIDDKEDEIASQWIDFTEMVVETAEKIKAESDDDLSIDEDMSRWREEARRLKADAVRRRSRKEAMFERRKRRRENAVKRHEEFLYKNGSRRREQESSDAFEAVANSRQRESRRGEEGSQTEDDDINDPLEIDSANSEDSDDNSEEGENSAPAVDPTEIIEAKKDALDKKEAEKKKEKKKKEKEQKPKKDVKKKDKLKHPSSPSKRIKSPTKQPSSPIKEIKATMAKVPDLSTGDPCGDDDDMNDGPDEKNPRHLDNTMWKNHLKFWTNKPKKLNETGAKYIFKTLPKTDCFRRTERTGNDNASFYWFKTEGDFDVIVKIKGNFRSSYDKAGIMLREDEKNWVLSGVEHFNGQLNHSTCITRGVSDWSLSPLPEEARDGVWFCVKRSGGKVECFFSMDLRKWVQTRQGLFTTTSTLKVGVAAACPMGTPFKVVFERFRVQNH